MFPVCPIEPPNLFAPSQQVPPSAGTGCISTSRRALERCLDVSTCSVLIDALGTPGVFGIFGGRENPDPDTRRQRFDHFCLPPADDLSVAALPLTRHIDGGARVGTLRSQLWFVARGQTIRNFGANQNYGT